MTDTAQMEALLKAWDGRLSSHEVAEIMRLLPGVLERTAELEAEVERLRGDHAIDAFFTPDELGYQARITELEAENARLRKERYEALSVDTREGLLASEWVARTGAAEAERDRLAAEVERLRTESVNGEAALCFATAVAALLDSHLHEGLLIGQASPLAKWARGLAGEGEE